MLDAVRTIGLLVLALVALSARGQSDAERTFRKWADEHVQVLQKDRNAGERIKAADYLGGFEYPDVINALDAALADPDSRVRAAAAGALWKSGKASEPARAHLMQALDDPSPAVVIRAAGALQTLGMSNAELAAARRRVFETPDIPNSDRYMAARGLIGYAPPVMLLYPILEFLERAAAPRPSSAQSIAERESFESAVSALERLAKTGDRALIVPMVEATRAARNSQAVLLKALGLFDPKPDGWNEMLVGYLASRDPKVREASLSLLGKEVREKDVLVWAPRAADLLSDPDSGVRSEALWSLSRAGGLASAQIDAVVVVLRDPDPATRKRAVAAIGEMGDTKQAVTAAAKTRVAERTRGAVAALAAADPDADVRAEAKATLAKLGGEAPATAAIAADPAASARSTTTPAEASAVALLRERKVTMESGSYFRALAGTDVPVVRAFLDAGMSASAPVASSGPPLVVMLQVGDACAPSVRPTKADTKTLIKLLLERGADANRGDGNGFTPLMAASMKGCDREVMRLLIGAGAKVGATNPMGISAFDMGLYFGHDGLEELIAAGYRLPPEKAKAYEKAFADKPAVLALVRKATRK
jgi:HEAT repeat protein